MEVIPASGSTPMSSRLNCQPLPIASSVEPDNKVRAMATGQAIAALTIIDPNGKFDALSGSATVKIPTTRWPSMQSSIDRPSETTVGAEVRPRRIGQQRNGTGISTNTETTLVLRQDQSDMAEVRAGCGLIARMRAN